MRPQLHARSTSPSNKEAYPVIESPIGGRTTTDAALARFSVRVQLVSHQIWYQAPDSI